MATDRERDTQIPPFRRFGLGYQYRPPEAPVVMTFSNVSEKRGEIRAELHVESAVSGGHVLRRYLNLLGSTSMRDLVKDLTNANEGGAYPWASILESATESIIRAIRVGPDLETYGGLMDRPPGISWLCEGLVMAGVPNVWIAAASTGKSTFATALCVCHAIGAPFLERPTTQGIPLYLDWESDADDFGEKLWLVSRGLGLRSVPTVHRLPMRGPASMHAAAIANRIDELGATLVAWDGIQAAGGSVGQYATYESIAMDLEVMLSLLPPTTHVLLDHVTGDELKASAVPLKGRGGSRKLEWTRNQWTLVLDRDAHHEQQHRIGWTHTKINRGAYLPAFGVEILHREDELGFRLLGEQEVKPLREKMADWRQVLGVLQEAGHPLLKRDIAARWLGASDAASLKKVGQAISQQHSAILWNQADGTFQPRAGFAGRVGATGTAAANGTVHEALRLLPDDEDVWEEPDELPF